MKTKEMPVQGMDLKSGVYRTPAVFMKEVKKLYDIRFDLAASEENTQAGNCFLDEASNALSKEWNWSELNRISGGYLWLNPPYDNIGKWAERCAIESHEGAKILFLVPASVGSNWYRNYVESFSKPNFLNGRLIFEFRYPADYMDRATIKVNNGRALVGLEPIVCPRAGQMNEEPYPKDLMLAVFDRDLDYDQRRAETWKWDTYL